MFKCVKCSSKVLGGGLKVGEMSCSKCGLIYRLVKGKWHSSLGKIKPWKEPVK